MNSPSLAMLYIYKTTPNQGPGPDLLVLLLGSDSEALLAISTQL